MTTEPSIEPGLTAEDFQSILIASGLAERLARDLGRLERMLRNADLIATARIDGELSTSLGRSPTCPTVAICPILRSPCLTSVAGIGEPMIERTTSGRRTQI